MARPRIMIVNDDTLFLSLMKELLEEEGYKATTWFEGDSAYEKIQQERPELIILDIRLERPDAGWMVLQHVRLDPEIADTPVIICSADTRFLRAKARRLRELGCETLEKPFRYDELIAKVAQLLPRT